MYPLLAPSLSLHKSYVAKMMSNIHAYAVQFTQRNVHLFQRLTLNRDDQAAHILSLTCTGNARGVFVGMMGRRRMSWWGGLGLIEPVYP